MMSFPKPPLALIPVLSATSKTQQKFSATLNAISASKALLGGTGLKSNIPIKPTNKLANTDPTL